MESGYIVSRPSSNRKLAVIGLVGIVAFAAAFMIYHSPSTSSNFLISKGHFHSKEFADYMMRYNKVYDSEDEMKARYAIWKDNLRSIRLHNSKHLSWYLKINQFSDMSMSEFENLYFRQTYTVELLDIEPTIISYPQSVNWVNSGVVTGVKQQGACGACWAFSTTGATESAWAIAGNDLVSLSEQQLIDCSSGNSGCNGGMHSEAFQYIIDNSGITTEENYPYVASSQNCNSEAITNIAATLTSYKSVAPNNWQALASAVAQQPVSVLVQASSSYWKSYGGGILNDLGCGTSLNHAVLAVGYDLSANPQYWYIKNSWGTGWGEGGYIRLAIVAGNGICGVQMSPVYPIV